jgi:prophage antirepressor-like protein
MNNNIFIKNIKMANTLIDLNNNKLTFDNKEITIININNELWFKGNDIAKLLGYSDPNRALSQHIKKDKYKLSYENMLKEGGRSAGSLSYNTKNTIYINESGLYKLIFKSQLKIAEDFQEWIQDDVLPQIRKTGSYSIQCDNLLESYNDDIFWNDNSISDYNDKNVIYLGYIGIHNNEKLYKFGKSEQIYTREFDAHQKTFEIFKMKHIELCDNSTTVEREFKKELKTKNLLRTLEINSKNQTELFTITPQNDINKIIQNLKELVERNPLQTIKDSRYEIEKLKYIHEIEKLNLEIEYLKNNLKELKDEYKEVKLENKELKNELKRNNIKLEDDTNIIEPIIIKEIEKNVIIKENKEIEKVVTIEENKKEEVEQLYISKETRGKYPLIYRPIASISDNITKKCLDNETFCDKFIEKGDDVIDNRYLIQTSILYQIYKENCVKPLGSMRFIQYIKNKYEIESKFMRWEDGQKLQTWVGIRLKECPDRIFADDKETDEFVKKYMEFGEDSSKNKWRAKSSDVYELYLEKCTKPLSKKTFNHYITQKYNIIRKNLTWAHNQSFQTWVGVILVNIPIKKNEFETHLDNFIESNCIIDDKLSIISRDFNLSFKKYCIKINFTPEGKNGWSEIKCRETLNKKGIMFEKKGHSIEKALYKGINLIDI